MRERTEMALSHERWLERKCPPRSEGGNQNKCWYDLEHSFYSAECQELLFMLNHGSNFELSWSSVILKVPEDNLSDF